MSKPTGLEDILEPTVDTLYVPPSPVLNENATLKTPYRIAIIGEAPGKDEVDHGRPFVGMSGKMLTQALNKNGIVREGCLIANICQIRPPNNDIKFFKRDGPEITSGLEQLAKDLETYQPNICLLLGKTALWAAKGVDNISDWRGSFFVGTKAPFLGRKCIASFHPAACLRQYDWTPLLLFDIQKCRQEAEQPELVLPHRELDVTPNVNRILENLERIQREKTKIAIDIEGGINSWSCISVATSPQSAFIIPLTKMDGTSYWSVDDECRLLRSLANALTDSSVPKILQNSLYDRFVLQYSYNIFMGGVVDDTMVKSWEKYCELEKGLGFLCSLYTKEPFYKSDRKTDDRETFWRYCCKDSALTYEINEVLDKALTAEQRAHYELNMGLLNVLLYMELRGIKYDQNKATQRLEETEKQLFQLQYGLDKLAGCGKEISLNDVQEALCYKRNPNQPKVGNDEAYEKCKRLFNLGNLSESDRGYLNVACGLSLNIKSSTFKTFLYETLKLPKQYKKDASTGKEHLSSDYESLLKIQKKQPHPAVDLALQIGLLRTRSQMLQISADKDGRIRCGYNIVGTETGRLTCYTSPTGSGYNLQTIPSDDSLKPVGHPLRRGMRDLFVADDGFYLFQCDLSGADGWTVAAHLASLGDTTMLEDYRAGIKPAKVLCYLLRHGASALNGKSRQEIKELTREVEKDSWDYFACKIGQHGTCYTMGARKLANQIFVQSEGKVSFSEGETSDLQRLFFIRYNVRLRHRWMERQVMYKGTPQLVSASGHVRRFFGRKTELLGEMLAHEPQANTTYATNLAAWRLWTDIENRSSNKSVHQQERRVGENSSKSTMRISDSDSCSKHRASYPNGVSLRIEPLHQVHDALIGQFPIYDTQWAVAKIRDYFNNPIQVAGISLTIPFDGSYGTSWGALDKGTI